MDSQYLKNIAVKVLSVLLCLFIVVYLAYHLISGFGEKIQTSPTELVTVNEKISVEAYIMRDETVLSSDLSGNISYSYTDGDKVQSGSVVANVYSGGEDSDKSYIMELDKRLNVLENSVLSDDSASGDSKKVETDTDDLFETMLKNTAYDDLDAVIRRRDEFLVLLNRRQLLTNTANGFDGLINELLTEKQNLNSSYGRVSDTVSAPTSGYFYSGTDGYEQIFSSANIDIFNRDDFDRITKADPEITSNNAIGKIVTDYKWYIVCEVESDKLPYFTEKNNYHVIFPFSADADLTMTLYRIINDTDNSRLLLIFECGTIKSDFNFLRRQSVDIVENSYTGYKVPVSAIRIVDGEKGVYILDGNVVKFRRINSVAEIDGYCIVAENPEDEEENEIGYLGLYDQIITKGKGLHENMVIE